MHFMNCTTRKPLFHNWCESYGLLTCIYTWSHTNDMHFTNCTTLKPLFHDLYGLYGLSTCIYTLRVANDMHLTNCRTSKPLFHNPYKLHKMEDAIQWLYQCMYIGQPLSVPLLSKVTGEVNGKPMKGEDNSDKEHSREVETKKILVKQASKCLQSRCKVQSKKARYMYRVLICLQQSAHVLPACFWLKVYWNVLAKNLQLSSHSLITWWSFPFLYPLLPLSTFPVLLIFFENIHDLCGDRTKEKMTTNLIMTLAGVSLQRNPYHLPSMWAAG